MDRQALVATGHPQVSEAGAEILRKGGNAFDAAVAAGFAAAIAEPLLTSLGGGGFLLSRTAAGEETLFDFFVDTPGKGLTAGELEPHFFPITVQFAGSAQEFNIGLGSAAVPGTLKGLLHVHERLGRLPLAETLAPAIRLGRTGVPLNRFQAYIINLLGPIVTLSAEGRRLYAPAGRYLTAGDRFANPALAAFLDDLPRSRGIGFYQAELAGRIAEDMRQGGGLLTREDLAGYRVIERRPLALEYRGRRLLTNPPPSFGGSLILAMLHVLAEVELGRMGWGSAEHLLTLAGAMEAVERRRAAAATGDFAFPADWYRAAGERIRRFSRGTTHISIVDRAGNAASMTTSNGEGSGYLVPGTGIMLNNMMGEDDLHPAGFHAQPPGHRVASMMAPSLLLRDGVVELVLGSGGSKRIRTAMVQVISNVVDFGLEIRAAVRAPRLHWDGTVLQIEPGYPPASLAALRQEWPVKVWEELEIYFGGTHAVRPGQGGAGDPRRGGDARSVAGRTSG